eukprot:scaffold94892_cov35-Attheya_sp.AAC.2
MQPGSHTIIFVPSSAQCALYRSVSWMQEQVKPPMLDTSHGPIFLVIPHFYTSSAQLSSAQLSSAQLSSAQLSSAQLSSAQLSSAQLTISSLFLCNRIITHTKNDEYHYFMGSLSELPVVPPWY